MSRIQPAPQAHNAGQFIRGYGHTAKENGHYYSILGLYRDNGRENGSYYLGFRVVQGLGYFGFRV